MQAATVSPTDSHREEADQQAKNRRGRGDDEQNVVTTLQAAQLAARIMEARTTVREPCLWSDSGRDGAESGGVTVAYTRQSKSKGGRNA